MTLLFVLVRRRRRALATAALIALAACADPQPTHLAQVSQSPLNDGGCTSQQLLVDPLNCGTCGAPCTVANGTPVCIQGQCLVGTCAAGFADLDSDAGDGCEYACPVFPRVPESCNLSDDDCNGIVDDGFDLKSDVNHCGGCGTACSLPNADSACLDGGCVVARCRPGFANLDGGAGCSYACPVWPPRAEGCNGIDDDCNGLVDDGVAVPPAFTCQTLGVCSGHAPAKVCCGTSGWQCDYTGIPNADFAPALSCPGGVTVKPLAATETECDTLDNNCNGTIDLDGFPTKGNACAAGLGACRNAGTVVCSGGLAVCNAVASPTRAVDELCNGIDDNCDGQIDERTPQLPLQCFNGAQHTCKGYVDAMTKSGSTWIYNFEASRADYPNGTVSNAQRACSKPNALPWTSLTEPQAAAACAAVKDSAGNPMRLCAAAEWQSACEGGVTQTQSYAFSSSTLTYAPLVCNDANNPLRRAWPTGTDNGQAKKCNVSATQIFDLSGNVSEWTSTSTTRGATTYFQVRGGSYTDLDDGTSGDAITCEANANLRQASYATNWLGFRCCSNAAP